MLKKSYLADELKTIGMLAKWGSASCTIYKELALNRQVIKNAFRKLNRNRHHQVTWAAIICGTRYKVYEDGRCYPVRCEVSPGCEEEDSLAHMLKCCNMTLPSKEEEEEVREDFLSQLVQRARVANPGFPHPIKTVKNGELEIEFPPSPLRSEGEISLEI